ncbi:MAG: hypothetical protein LBS19_11590 [Clostridiales bacterium]|jgi:hypothetical protein|nr:hypothetical protein [Clostridiales bacterium]
MPREEPLTVKEFAEAIKVTREHARYMARSEFFKKHRISIDIALDEIKRPKAKHGTGRRNHNWRIYLSRYEAALAKAQAVN